MPLSQTDRIGYFRQRKSEEGEMDQPQAIERAARQGLTWDANRLRTQMEIIRDVMLAAADCDTWLTLHQLASITRFGEASISAQLRNLRKSEHGGYRITKRRTTGELFGFCIWEYQLVKDLGAERLEMREEKRTGA